MEVARLAKLKAEAERKARLEAEERVRLAELKAEAERKARLEAERIERERLAELERRRLQELAAEKRRQQKEVRVSNIHSTTSGFSTGISFISNLQIHLLLKH